MTKSKTTTSPISGGALTGINLNLPTQATVKKDEEYPLLPDPNGVYKAAVDTLTAIKADIAKLEASEKRVIGQLSEAGVPFYYTANEGTDNPSHGIRINGSGDNHAKVIVENRYVKFDENLVKNMLGAKLFNEVMEPQVEIAVKLDAVRDSNGNLDQAKINRLVKAITNAAEKEGVSEIVSVSKNAMVPKTSFWVKRHKLFKAAANLELQSVLPTRISVRLGKTK